MGALTWVVASMAAVLLAHWMPIRRRHAAALEAVVAIIAGVICGIGATALDFGGWTEPDWRAALLAFFGAFALVGALRIPRHSAR